MMGGWVFLLALAAGASGACPSIGSGDGSSGSEYHTVASGPDTGEVVYSETVCAEENSLCLCDGEVRYGMGDVYTEYTTVTQGIGCNNGVFGDPLPGVRKQCLCLAPDSSEEQFSVSVGCEEEGDAGTGASGTDDTGTWCLETLIRIEGDLVLCVSSREDEVDGRRSVAPSILPALTHVTGSIIIQQADDDDETADLELPLLEVVNGSFSVREIDIPSLQLPSLRHVGGKFELEELHSLTLLNLDALETVGGEKEEELYRGYGRLEIDDCSRLETVNLPVLRHVNSHLWIYDNVELVTVHLPALEVVAEELYLGQEDDDEIGKLSNISCSMLHSVGDDVVILRTRATSLSFPSLTNVSGDLEVYDNALLLDVELPVLEHVGGDVFLGQYEEIRAPLASISLPSLESVGDDFEVVLTSVLELRLPSLASVMGYLWVYDNDLLTVVDFPSLEITNGEFYVGQEDSEHPGLLSTLNFPNLVSVGRELSVVRTQLTQLILPVLASVHDLDIYDNSVLTSISAPSLVSVTSSIYFGQGDNVGQGPLETFNFSNLQSVAGYLEFERAGPLVDFRFPSLRSVGHGIWLEDTDCALGAVADFPALTELHGSFLIDTSSGVTSVHVPLLTRIDDSSRYPPEVRLTWNSDLEVVEMPALTHVDGVSTRGVSGRVVMTDNEALHDVYLPSLEMVREDLWIGQRYGCLRDGGITNLSMSQLHSVGGEIHITGTELVQLSLANISVVDGGVVVLRNNPFLQQISLGDIESWPLEIELFGSPVLASVCVAAGVDVALPVLMEATANSPSTCVDGDWVDRDGDGCSVYVSHKWCNTSNVAWLREDGGGWYDSWGSLEDWGGQVCCDCGGRGAYAGIHMTGGAAAVKAIPVFAQLECPVLTSETNCFNTLTTYRGTLNITVSGQSCFPWQNSDPISECSGVDPSHNYCRNPDGKLTTWCYVDAEAQQWEYCDACTGTTDSSIDVSAVYSVAPTPVPSTEPTMAPTSVPSANPTMVPSAIPTLAPSREPSSRPTSVPTSAQPSTHPSAVPSLQPTLYPTDSPTSAPSLHPSTIPTTAPTAHPTAVPTIDESEDRLFETYCAKRRGQRLVQSCSIPPT